MVESPSAKAAQQAYSRYHPRDARRPQRVMLHLALLSLTWPRSPPLLAQPPRAALRPLSVAVAQRAARSVLMCSEPVTVMVGGQPVEEGDGLLCRDAESDAWWRATVKAISGSRVLVHYTGCSDEWDLWMEADSTDLMRAEAGGVQPAAFQSEEYEEGLDDEELLDAMRERKWAENARWQLNVFAQEQLGDWQGERPCRNPEAGVAGDRRPRRLIGRRWPKLGAARGRPRRPC